MQFELIGGNDDLDEDAYRKFLKSQNSTSYIPSLKQTHMLFKHEPQQIGKTQKQIRQNMKPILRNSQRRLKFKPLSLKKQKDDKDKQDLATQIGQKQIQKVDCLDIRSIQKHVTKQGLAKLPKQFTKLNTSNQMQMELQRLKTQIEIYKNHGREATYSELAVELELIQKQDQQLDDNYDSSKNEKLPITISEIFSEFQQQDQIQNLNQMDKMNQLQILDEGSLRYNNKTTINNNEQIIEQIDQPVIQYGQLNTFESRPQNMIAENSENDDRAQRKSIIIIKSSQNIVNEGVSEHDNESPNAAAQLMPVTIQEVAIEKFDEELQQSCRHSSESCDVVSQSNGRVSEVVALTQKHIFNHYKKKRNHQIDKLLKYQLIDLKDLETMKKLMETNSKQSFQYSDNTLSLRHHSKVSKESKSPEMSKTREIVCKSQSLMNISNDRAETVLQNQGTIESPDEQKNLKNQQTKINDSTKDNQKSWSNYLGRSQPVILYSLKSNQKEDPIKIKEQSYNNYDSQEIKIQQKLMPQSTLAKCSMDRHPQSEYQIQYDQQNLELLNMHNNQKTECEDGVTQNLNNQDDEGQLNINQMEFIVKKHHKTSSQQQFLKQQKTKTRDPLKTIDQASQNRFERIISSQRDRSRRLELHTCNLQKAALLNKRYLIQPQEFSKSNKPSIDQSVQKQAKRRSLEQQQKQYMRQRCVKMRKSERILLHNTGAISSRVPLATQLIENQIKLQKQQQYRSNIPLDNILLIQSSCPDEELNQDYILEPEYRKISNQNRDLINDFKFQTSSNRFTPRDYQFDDNFANVDKYPVLASLACSTTHCNNSNHPFYKKNIQRLTEAKSGKMTRLSSCQTKTHGTFDQRTTHSNNLKNNNLEKLIIERPVQSNLKTDRVGNNKTQLKRQAKMIASTDFPSRQPKSIFQQNPFKSDNINNQDYFKKVTLNKFNSTHIDQPIIATSRLNNRMFLDMAKNKTVNQNKVGLNSKIKTVKKISTQFNNVIHTSSKNSIENPQLEDFFNIQDTNRSSNFQTGFSD